MVKETKGRVRNNMKKINSANFTTRYRGKGGKCGSEGRGKRALRLELGIG